MKDKRFFINLIKGVAIFFMLWGHCIQYCVTGSDIDFFENEFFQFIYSFHMPLFMLVSGYLFYFSFSKRELITLLKHRTQGMLQPIVFGNIFIFMVTTFLFALLKGEFSLIFNGGWMSSLTSLWFLWSVLSVSIVVGVICKKVNKFGLQIIFLFLAVFIVALFPNMEMNVYMYPYFVFGFYFAKYENKLQKEFKIIKYSSLVIFPIMFYFYDKQDFIYTSGLFDKNIGLKKSLEIDLYRWVIGLLGSAFIVTILRFVFIKITSMKKCIISRGLADLGDKSLQIYVLSVPFLSVYLYVAFPYILNILGIRNIFVENEFIYNFIFTFSLAIIYSIVLLLILKVLEKLKIDKLIFCR